MEVPMTLDEALLFRQRAPRYAPRALASVGLGLLVCGLPLSMWAPMLGHIVCVVGFVPVLAGSVRLIRWNREHERYTKAIDIALDKYSWGKYEAAQAVYGDHDDAVMAMWECQEAHVPGDCILCGAE